MDEIGTRMLVQSELDGGKFWRLKFVSTIVNDTIENVDAAPIIL